MTDAPQAAPIDDKPKFEWAVVEIFGHRRHAGRTIEEERFGAKMLRIDVPVKGDPEQFGWQTFYYGGASIFSFALTDEASVMKFNKPYEPPTRLSIADRSEKEDFDEDNEYDE